jgi:hypothetical protein
MIKMDSLFFILLGVLVTWFDLSALHMWGESTDNHTAEQVLEIIVNAPMITVGLLGVLLSFPFIWLWKFFRNAIKGVSIDTWNRVKVPKYWVIGNFRLCYDNRAKAWVNKVFLVRVIKPGNLVHEPALEMRKHP